MLKENRIALLIKKFANNKCSDAEIEELISLLKQNKVSESDIDVDTILESIEKPEVLDDKNAKKIYSNILESNAFRNRNTRFLSKKTAKLAAYAAVFIALISVTIFNNYIPVTNKKPNLNSLISEENVTIKLTDGAIEVVTKNTKPIENKKGEVIGEIKNNVLTLNNQKEPKDTIIKYNTINVPYGKTFELSLADGTRVKINAGTSLKFPTSFSNAKNRTVYLQGEAFFEVSKDKKHPFIVKTENLDVEVLGTEFNVSAYNEDIKSQVFLVEGSVKLSKENKIKEPVLLVPGELGSLNQANTQITVEEASSYAHTSWMHGELILRNVKFENLLKKLERHFNVSIQNENTELANKIFNANFGDQSIEMVFKYLKEIHDIDYKIDENTIIIK